MFAFWSIGKHIASYKDDLIYKKGQINYCISNIHELQQLSLIWLKWFKEIWCGAKFCCIISCDFNFVQLDFFFSRFEGWIIIIFWLIMCMCGVYANLLMPDLVMIFYYKQEGMVNMNCNILLNLRIIKQITVILH